MVILHEPSCKNGGIDHIKIPISPNRLSIIDSYKDAYSKNEVVIPSYNRDLDYEIFNSMKSNGSNIMLDGLMVILSSHLEWRSL